jgi:superfamily II DNA/RNA helicase
MIRNYARSLLAASRAFNTNRILKNAIKDDHKPLDSVNGLYESLKSKLKLNGINEFFPIQSATFDVITKGGNILAKAQTGTGKTLAFVLPILNKLSNGNAGNVSFMPKKRTPSAMIMCPTRELAKQVHAEVEKFKDRSIGALCVYGGVGYQQQISALERQNIDVIVGTPGRLLDLVEKGYLSLAQLSHLVLDEADHMLDIGFKDDMETLFKIIRKHKGTESKTSLIPSQVMLFSATVPKWVHSVKQEYLGPNSVTVDLVGDHVTQANSNITYVSIPCLRENKRSVVGDIVRLYARSTKNGKSRCIVFTETKTEADELANVLSATYGKTAALHGDVSQNFREKIIKDFRAGGFNCLVATDVAARGLDVPSVDLVLQYDVPAKVEPFLHRSGRTGRAGNQGTCVVLFNPLMDNGKLSDIEKRAKIEFETRPIPRVQDIMSTCVDELVQKVGSFDRSHLDKFRQHADKLCESMNAKDAIAALFALNLGMNDTSHSERSSISGQEGMVTFVLKSQRRPIDYRGIKEILNGVSVSLNRNSKIFQTDSVKSIIIDIPESFRSVVKGTFTNFGYEVEEAEGILPKLKVSEGYNKYDSFKKQNGSYRTTRERSSFSNADSRKKSSYLKRESRF